MIPNMLAEVEKCKKKFPQAWADAHTGNAHTEDFIRILASDLHLIDPKFGLNGKRGVPSDLSDDALNYLCHASESTGRTPEGLPCVVIDVIGSAGTSAAYPTWQVFAQAPEANGAWVKPMPVVNPPTPQPPTPTYPSYEALGGDEGGKKITRQLEADYRRAGKPGLDGDCGAWQQRVSYDFLTGICATVEESITKHRAEWCAALGIPVA